MRALVEIFGYEAREHPSAEEFLETYCALNPGCLLVDHNMPGASGIELLEYLWGRGHRMPTALMSGRGDRTMRAQAERLGAIYFDKPCDDDRLLGWIEQAQKAGVELPLASRINCRDCIHFGEPKPTPKVGPVLKRWIN